MRILPHDQNSGGFFLAMLRKTEGFRIKGEQGQGEKEGEGEGEKEGQGEGGEGMGE